MDEPRLFLVDSDPLRTPAEWVLSEETRTVGRRGVADARMALRSASAAVLHRRRADAA
jgi:hypothetical protein